MCCAPRTCDDTEERQLVEAVDLLIGEPGAVADQARDHIVSRGRSAIAILETGLYIADGSGRRQVVRALVDIGHPDVIPILVHVARRDDDAEVRTAALAGLRSLGHAVVDPPPET